MEIDETYLKNQISDFRDSFCPYGYLDVKRAVEVALEIGENAGWAFGEVERFADECGMKLADVDPCYVVFDAVLQRARREIEDLTGFDIQNDASFETHGNYCASCYDWRTDDLEELTERLRSYMDRLEDLEDVTKYWLAQVDINIETIEPIGEDNEEED